MESAKVCILWRKKVGMPWNFPRKMPNSGQYPTIAITAQKYGSILISSLSVSISVVTFSSAFTFSQLTVLVNMVSTWRYFSLNGICHLSIVLISYPKNVQGNVPKLFFFFTSQGRKTKFNRGHFFIKNINAKTNSLFISLAIYLVQ